MKRFLQLAVLLAFLPVAGVAQVVQAGVIIVGGIVIYTFFGWYESDPVQVCKNGQIFYVTYRIYYQGGFPQIPVKAEGPFGPCTCTVSFVTQPQTNSFSLLRPRVESNCDSNNPQGKPVTIPNQAASGSTGGYGGAGPRLVRAHGIAEGPDPRDPPSPPHPLAQYLENAPPARLAPRATSGSAFTYTLPFRALPAGPLITEVTAPQPWTCNAGINPTMFRVSHVDNVVKRYNLCTSGLLATIPVASLPLQVRVTPDGSEAIVASYGGAITFIDTTTNTVAGTIQPLGDANFAPSGVAISPDGAYALVTNYLTPPNSYLAVVDIAGRKIQGKIPLNYQYPQSVYLNPDGTLAWVTHPWDSVVEIVDILTGTVVQSLSVNEPFSIVFNPTGTRAFVASGGGSVKVIDTSTYQVTKSVPADFGATDLQITPDGAFIYVNNSDAQSVTLIDTRALTATTTNIGGAPQGSVLVPTK